MRRAMARVNARQSAVGFAIYIFRQMSWMKHLLARSWVVDNALIGACGPRYLNLIVPSPTMHALDIKVNVENLSGPECVVLPLQSFCHGQTRTCPACSRGIMLRQFLITLLRVQ